MHWSSPRVKRSFVSIHLEAPMMLGHNAVFNPHMEVACIQNTRGSN